MNCYKELACEFLDEMDRGNSCPRHPDDVSTSMRGEMAVLRLLDNEKRRLTAGEISKLLNMTTPRIAAVLKGLEKKGMIERGGDESDRRRVLVTLTEKGNAFCQARKDAVVTRLAMIFEAIGPEDTRAFIRVIRRVREAAAQLCEAHGDIHEPFHDIKTEPLNQGGKAV